MEDIIVIKRCDTSDDELRHWGIKGMKWGQRRFQNKDGTLTPAGVKRYNKEMEKLKAEQKILKNKQKTQAKIDKLESLRKEIDEGNRQLSKKMSKERNDADENVTVKNTDKSNSKSIKKWSDEDLQTRIDRLEKEKSYKKLMKETDTVSKGKDVVYGIVEKVGKDLLEQTLAYATEAAVNKYLFKGEDAIDPKNIQNRRKK